MAGARGDALEWALALSRAPGERHALRHRDLPDGIETLLQIASGNHGPAMDRAVERSGMQPAALVEAARFYLREVLFFPGADAYRLLGVGRNADDALIKHHHRLLQQWLHPDRPASDWDSTFAARVNAAWSQLRTAARREAYEAELQARPPEPPAEPSWSAPARVRPDPIPVPDGVEARWRRRAPVLGLLAVCGLLGVLAIRDMQRDPMEAFAETQVEGAPGLPGSRAAADSTQKPAAMAVTTEPAAKPPVVVATAKPAPKPAVKPPVVVATAKPAPTPAAKPPVVVATAKPAPTPAAKSPVVVAAAKPPVVVAAAKPAPTPAAKPPVLVAAAKPAPKPAAKPPVVVAAAKPAPTPAAKPPVVVAAAKPPVVVAAAKPAPTPAAKPAVIPGPRSTRSVASQPAPVVAKSAPSPASGEPRVGQPAAAMAIALPVVDQARRSAQASPQQISQAQRTGQQLLAFVADRSNKVPPIWASVSAQGQASQARASLQGGRARPGDPRWRIGGSDATMTANMGIDGSDARRLRVELVWRDQRWLVQSLALEPGA